MRPYRRFPRTTSYLRVAPIDVPWRGLVRAGLLALVTALVLHAR